MPSAARVCALVLLVLASGCAPQQASRPEDPVAADTPTAAATSPYGSTTARTEAASIMASEHAEVIAQVAQFDGYGGVHLRNDVGSWSA